MEKGGGKGRGKGGELYPPNVWNALTSLFRHKLKTFLFQYQSSHGVYES